MNGIKTFSALALAVSLTACQSAPKEMEQSDQTSTVETLPTYAQITFPNGSTADGTKYRSGKADLNGDGQDEVLLLLQGMNYCGSGGCTAFIIDSNNKQLVRMTVTEAPIMLGNRKSNGWQDLVIWSDSSLRLVKHDGTSYPSNPSMTPRYNQEANKKRAIALLTNSPEYQSDGYGISYHEEVPIFNPVSRFNYNFKSESVPTKHYSAVVDVQTGEVIVTAHDTHHHNN